MKLEIFLAVISCILQVIYGSPWYQGCFRSNSLQQGWMSLVTTVPPEVDSCSRQCHLLSFHFAAVSSSICSCGNTTSLLTSENESACTERCNQLPCGGPLAVSVYSTTGPYLLSAKLHPVSHPYVHRSVVLQSSAVIASSPDTQELSSFNISDSNVFHVEWVADGSVIWTENVTAINESVTSLTHHTFVQEGVKNIVVTFTNAISSITIETNLTIYQPVPSNLQLILSSVYPLPSCVPVEYAGKNVLAVFKNNSITIEAAVSRGVNLTFDWWFSDTSATYRTTCQEELCINSSLDHIFKQAGQLQVMVNVSNVLGSTQEQLSVVVMENTLDNLTITTSLETRKVQQDVSFFVSLHTPTRQNTFLDVDFGDGEIVTYGLVEADDSSYFDSNAMANLISSYGSGCSLNISVLHTYTTEGNFTVNIRARNNMSEINYTMPHPIETVHELNNMVVVVIAYGAINTSTSISVKFGSIVPQNVVYNWTITNMNISTVSFHEDNNSPFRSHRFTEVGVYKIEVAAENKVSRASVSGHIEILMPISGVRISYNSSKHVATNDIIHVQATVTSGSRPIFNWDFSDHSYQKLVYNSDMSSLATYSYRFPGLYNISVSVQNILGTTRVALPYLIAAEDAIDGLAISTNSPVAIGNPVEITIGISDGSSVKFDVDFRTSKQLLDMTDQSKQITTNFTYSQPGEYAVRIKAYNNVSQESKEIKIEVQSVLPEILLVSPGPVLIGKKAIIAVQNNGVLQLRNDTIYKWLINFNNAVGVAIVTKVPFWTGVMEQQGVYTVNVTAMNSVSSVTATLPVTVVATLATIRIDHNGTYHVGDTVEFVVEGLPSSGQLDITYDGSSASKVISVPFSSDQITVTDIYSAPGIYNASFSTAGQLVWTLVTIDEQISGLALTGPPVVQLQSILVSHVWVAETQSGTNLLYKWILDGATYWTAGNKLSKEFTKPGIFNLSVSVQNGLNTMTTSQPIISQHPVDRVIYSPHYNRDTVLGKRTMISLDITAGREFWVKVDFGDGNSTILSSEQPGLEIITLRPVNENQLHQLPVCRVNTYHTYRSIGEYTITANVSNHLSYVIKSHTTKVEEPIRGLVLTMDGPAVVSIGTQMFITATVTSGKDLRFEWNLYGVIIANSANSSTARYTFRTSGKYRVQACVTHIYDTAKTCAFLPANLTVVQPIQRLSIREENNNYGASLIKSAGTEKADVTFVARVEAGSNVHVLVEFGDGENGTGVMTESGFSFMLTEISARITHSYKKEGNFTVKVHAWNELSNASAILGRTLLILRPPQGLQIYLPASGVYVKFGNSLNITASVDGGTDVCFNWDMGDGTTIINGGNTISHQYQRVTPSGFRVTVTASNQVASIQEHVNIYVQHEIQDCTLSVQGGDLHRVSTPILFTVTTIPAHNSMPKVLLEWSYNGGISGTPAISSTVNTKEIRYKYAGRFVVEVTAKNQFSSAVCDPQIIHAVQPVGSMRIQVMTWGRVNSAFKFKAIGSGSNVTYKWDFGDGNVKTVNDHFTVEHNYTRSGMFTIKLSASNIFGNATTEDRVFVLEHTCVPPRVDFLPAGNIKLEYSKMIQIEAEVTPNTCHHPNALQYVYKWSIKHVNGTVVDTPGVNPQIFNRKILMVKPMGFLEYGEYILELKVLINNTIVFTTKHTNISVQPTPLIPVISGGIMVFVHVNETVVLNGTETVNMDNLNGTLSFNWTCHLLANDQNPCFHDNASLPPMNTPVVKFKTDVFLPGESEFVFVLIVSDRDVINSTSQVMRIGEQYQLSIGIHCPACINHIVNTDEELLLTVTCDNCDLHDNITYEWEIFKVENGYWSVAGAHDNGKCVDGDGSTYDLMRLVHANTTTVSTTEVTSPATTTTSSTSTTTTAAQNNNPLWPFFNGRRRRSLLTGRYKRQFPIIGQPSEGGTSGGRGTGIGSGIGSGTGGRPTPSIGPPSTPSPGDNVIDSITNPKRETHLVGLKRTLLELDDSSTRTGFDKKKLLLRAGTLRQGHTNMISVTVTDSNRQGNAWVSFTANESPFNGKCQITPDQGTELETFFQPWCYSWEDKNTPMIYEFSISMEESSPRRLIYRGLNHEFSKFRLPAGLPEHNYTVYVHLSVIDSLGSRTSVCSETVRILPKDGSSRTNLDQELRHEIYDSESNLGRVMSMGDYGSARVNLQLIAGWMNRLSKESPEYLPKDTRSGFRFSLLEKLKKFPVRDEGELAQTVAALEWITAQPHELNVTSLAIASELVSNVNIKANDLYHLGWTLDEDLLRLAVSCASNILESAAILGCDHSTQTVPYVRDATAALEGILQLQLHSTLPHEPEFSISTPFISISTGKYSTRHAQTITSRDGTFQLPGNMAATGSLPWQQDCYETSLVSYKQNPYYDQEVSKVQTSTASLNMYDCEGQELAMKNLTLEKRVRFQLPNQKEKKTDTLLNFTLAKERMNIHQFNVTDTSRSLHLNIEISQRLEGRRFPIAVLLSYETPPNPSTPDKQVFERTVNNIKLYKQPGSFNKTGTYYLGIVDANFNAGRHYEGEVHSVDYVFKFWWGECLFWDVSAEKWASDGCISTETSTYDTTHCSCNHLTTFAGHFSLVPNVLSFVSVEDFYGANENYVTAIFIAVVVCIYILVLIMFCLLDREQQPIGVLQVRDNCLADEQKYLVTLETGSRKGAGTTAKVSLILHGEEGISETRELVATQSGHQIFTRGSANSFILTFPHSLGKLWKVQLWHNNTGSSPSWYLSTVVVKDLNTGRKFYFLCEKWFAVEEEDGKVEREVPVLEGSLRFGQIFLITTRQFFPDYHLEGSVISQNQFTWFTRAERLTCCLTLLMSYMCLNAMWYQWEEKEYRGEFGLLDLSWRSITVGAVCSAIVFPLYALLAAMFRMSKLKGAKLATEEKYKSAKTEDDVSEAEEYESEAVQPVMTPSLLDQSLAQWQSLQEWAQKQYQKRYQMSMSSSESVKPKRDYEEVSSSGFEDCLSQGRTTVVTSSSSERDTESQHSDDKATEAAEFPAEAQPHHFLLPFWFRYIAWILCVLIIFGCGGVTVLYGFRFGHMRSVMWLQSLYFSFMTSVFLIQPVVILLYVVCTALRYHGDLAILDPGVVYDDNSKEEELQKQISMFGYHIKNEEQDLAKGIAARKRSRYLRFARPPQEKELIKARRRTMKEKKAYAIVWDTLSFILVFVVLVIMAFGKDKNTAYRLNQSVKDAFVRNSVVPFTDDNIETLNQWWHWSSTGLLDVLYSQKRQADYFSGTTNTLIIGHVNLRQLRVQNMCSRRHQYNISQDCRPGYKASTRDESNHGDGINYTYASGDSLERNSLYGRMGLYDGSGYVIQLNNTRSDVQAELKILQDSEWTSLQTRAIIIEYTTFHAPSSLFTSVKLLTEFPPTGSALTRTAVTSVYLYRYISTWDNFILACELLFIVFMLYRGKNMLCEWIIDGRKYFLNPWHCLETALCVLALTFTVCYIYRFVLVHETVYRLRSTYHERYVDITCVADWDQALDTILGLMLFMVMMQFLSLLRYNKVFAALGNVYKKASKDLLVFLLAFLVWVCAFSSFGAALFGSVSFNFHTLWDSAYSVTNMLTGSYAMTDTIPHHSILGPLYLVMFMIFALGSLTAFSIAILSFHRRHHQQEEVLSMTGSEVIKFFWAKFLNCVSCDREKEGEQEKDDTLPPEFTIAEIEYQVDELLCKMSTLTGEVQSGNKMPGYYTDSDTYGVGDDGISSGSSEVHQFDEERFEQRIHKIEENLYSHEPHLAQLIQLDSIGALRNMNKEEENQLRNELEMEIFRQLQMQRQESNLHSEGYSSGSHGIQNSEGHASGKTSPSDGVQEDVPREDSGKKQSHIQPNEQDKLNDAAEASSCNHAANNRHSAPSLSQPAYKMYETLLKEALGDPHLHETMLKETPKDHKASAKTKYPTQPNTNAQKEEKSSDEKSEHSQGHHGNKPRPITSVGERSLARNYANIDSSTASSDDEAGRRLKKRHEAKLRKTRSRGRGKGKQTLTTGESLDDLAFDNDGYASDSDGHGDSKQCWV